MSAFPRNAVVCLVGLLFCLTASAQWVERTYHLEPGWNAIFLDAEPYPDNSGHHFDNQPVMGVWAMRDGGLTTRTAGRPPVAGADSSPHWRVYYPSHSPHHEISDLYLLEAGRAYLVEASANFTWTFTGRPKVRDRQWSEDGYSLAGFYVTQDTPAYFGDFLIGVDDSTPPEAYHMDASGSWLSVGPLDNTVINPGEGYLVYGKFRYGAGPVRVETTFGDGFEYPDRTSQQVLRLHCEAGATRVVSIASQSSAASPVDLDPGDTQSAAVPNAGDVALRWRYADNFDADWQDLPAEITLSGDDNGEQIELLFAIDRLAMEEAAPNATPDDLFQSLLEVTDSQGYRRLIYVNGTTLDLKGLWLGHVTLNQVSEPFHNGIEQPLDPTSAQTSFSMLLHVDEAGTIRLVDEVTQAWRPDEALPEGGENVLLTRSAPEELVNEISTTLDENDPQPLRLSSAVFFLLDADQNPVEVPVQGTFRPGETLQTTVVLHDNNPTNPFHHKFHPDHTWFADPMPSEIWDVTRELTLTLDRELSNNRQRAGWGNQWLQGEYHERLSGLHRNAIAVGGTVMWLHVSHVPTLNAGEVTR